MKALEFVVDDDVCLCYTPWMYSLQQDSTWNRSVDDTRCGIAQQ